MAAISDGSEFEKVSHENHPRELDLKRENNSDYTAHFLDINIKTVKKFLSVSSYDKKDSFPFSIFSISMSFTRFNGKNSHQLPSFR